MAITLHICPKCTLSIVDNGSVPIGPVLKAHAKTCGAAPARVARVKAKAETALPPLEANAFIDGVADRLVKAAAEMLKTGVKNAMKGGKRR